MARSSSLIDSLPKFMYIRAEDFDSNIAIINTGVSPVGSNIIRVTGIDWSVTPTSLASTAAIATDQTFVISLSAGSVPEAGYDDPNLIWTQSAGFAFTTSGSSLFPCSGQVTFTPFYIALPTMCLFVSWGVVVAVNARIAYDIVAVSELDLLRLIQVRG